MDGWVKLHRKIIVSDIYQMPPLYLRVFLRLLIEANHQDNEIPYREKGQSVVGKKLIKRGERLTSVRDICKWVAWYERGCLKEPNPKTIQNILDWLEENNMIEIYGAKGNRKETLYTIVNYDTYQDKDSDKVTEKKQLGNSLETEKQQSLETNKNVKNDKNEKNINKEKENPKAKSIRFVPPSLEEVEAYCKSRNNKVDAGQFIDFYESKGWMVGKNKMKDWKASVRTWEKRDSQPKIENKPTNKFNQFPQRTYTASDYADIERKLINKGL